MMKLYSNYSLKKRRAFAGILFSSPFIIGLIFLFIPALINLFTFSLNDIEVLIGGKGYELALCEAESTVCGRRSDLRESGMRPEE